MKNTPITKLEDIYNIPFDCDSTIEQSLNFGKYRIQFRSFLKKENRPNIRIKKNKFSLTVSKEFINEFLQHLFDPNSDLIERILNQMKLNSLRSIWLDKYSGSIWLDRSIYRSNNFSTLCVEIEEIKNLSQLLQYLISINTIKVKLAFIEIEYKYKNVHLSDIYRDNCPRYLKEFIAQANYLKSIYN